jgi:hypothetical protein
MDQSGTVSALAGLVLIASGLVWPAAAQPPVPTGPGGGPGPSAPPPGPPGGPGAGPAQPPPGAPPGGPGEYDFAAPPGRNFNRVYGVNRATGQVHACQYQSGGALGSSLCFGSGQGAGPQAQGDYRLVATNLNDEGGVFRVNRRTGEMSVCYVLDSSTVCTAPQH